VIGSHRALIGRALLRVLCNTSLALLLLGCDPAVGMTLRLTPSPVLPSVAVSQAQHPDEAALEALDRVAQVFGLDKLPEGGGNTCDAQWLLSGSRRQTGLAICATRSDDGNLEVSVGEFFASHWSPRGDSLRRAVADTLARYGQVRIPR
jgi:hypothetical protein